MSRQCSCYTCKLVTAAIDLAEVLEKMKFQNQPDGSVRLFSQEHIGELIEKHKALGLLLPGKGDWK